MTNMIPSRISEQVGWWFMVNVYDADDDNDDTLTRQIWIHQGSAKGEIPTRRASASGQWQFSSCLLMVIYLDLRFLGSNFFGGRYIFGADTSGLPSEGFIPHPSPRPAHNGCLMMMMVVSSWWWRWLFDDDDDDDDGDDENLLGRLGAFSRRMWSTEWCLPKSILLSLASKRCWSVLETMLIKEWWSVNDFFYVKSSFENILICTWDNDDKRMVVSEWLLPETIVWNWNWNYAKSNNVDQYL